MPDLGILIDLADFYDVDIREILDGERKIGNMDNETKCTLKKVAEYTEEQNKRLRKKMTEIMAGSAVLIIFCSVLVETNAFSGSIPESSYRNIISFTFGITLAAFALNIMFLTGLFEKMSQWKTKHIENKRKS